MPYEVQVLTLNQLHYNHLLLKTKTDDVFGVGKHSSIVTQASAEICRQFEFKDAATKFGQLGLYAWDGQF